MTSFHGWFAGLAVGAALLAAAPAQALAPAHPSPIPTRTQVPLGSAVWYACADPAYGGPAILGCPVAPAAPATVAGQAAAYTTAFTASFDRLTPENEFKMVWTEPKQNQWDFKVADKVATFARARGMHVRGHALIYAAASPGWITKPLLAWGKTSLLNAMKKHITTTVTHFKTAFPGVVDQWDVVNEPFLDDGSRDPNVFQKTIGNTWIEEAFKAANAADPNALLYLNEFNAETDTARQRAVYALVKDFVARKIPIDGVGLEMHVGADGSYPTTAELTAVMGQYAALGLRVAVTELDVLRPVTYDGGATQRAAYDQVAEACRQMPNCVSTTVWGVADPFSWRSADQHADLLDDTFARKSAYDDVRCRLNDPRPATGAWTPVGCPSAAAIAPTTSALTTGPTDGSSAGSG